VFPQPGAASSAGPDNRALTRRQNGGPRSVELAVTRSAPATSPKPPPAPSYRTRGTGAAL
jgi:hypothetical protein